MPGTSVSHLIWFIIALVVASGLAGVLTQITYDYREAIEARSQALAGELQTKIKIINDPENVPYDPLTNTLVIYIKNIGEFDLSKSGIIVAVNGTTVSPPETAVTIMNSDTERWSTGVVARVNATIPGLQPNIEYQLYVVVNGKNPHTHQIVGSAEDTIRFEIRII